MAVFTILIVDDNRSDREGIRNLINWDELNIRVVGLAVNGADGYGKAIGLKPDFVLTDVAMPVMNGLEMAEKIKNELHDTKFIFISCFEDFNYVKGAINLNAYAYVLKPIKINELVNALIKVRDSKQDEIDLHKMQEELKQQLIKNAPLLQEQFFRDLLYGKLQDENDIEQRMECLGINYKDKTYVVIFVEIDNYDLIYKDTPIEQKYILIHSIRRYTEDMLSKEYTTYPVVLQYNSLAVILFADKKYNENFLDNIIEMLSKYKNYINEKLQVSITIGVGERTNGLMNILKEYERAEYAVKSKFYSQNNRIIVSTEVKTAEPFLQFDPLCLKNELGHILEQDGKNDLLAFIDKYFEQNMYPSEEYLKGLGFAILNIAQITLVEKNESFSNIFGSDTDIWEKLFRFETISDIKQCLVNALETVRDYLNRQGKNRYRKIVEDIKNIVDENYGQISNIEQIVKPLYISASYANHIFKQQTGMSIFDYLIERRMEAAKKMLSDENVRIYEVSEKVGYLNKSYFITLFKEYTGLTPKQYMDKYSK